MGLSSCAQNEYDMQNLKIIFLVLGFIALGACKAGKAGGAALSGGGKSGGQDGAISVEDQCAIWRKEIQQKETALADPKLSEEAKAQIRQDIEAMKSKGKAGQCN